MQDMIELSKVQAQDCKTQLKNDPSFTYLVVGVALVGRCFILYTHT
jgi:hypothetical protein